MNIAPKLASIPIALLLLAPLMALAPPAAAQDVSPCLPEGTNPPDAIACAAAVPGFVFGTLSQATCADPGQAPSDPLWPVMCALSGQLATAFEGVDERSSITPQGDLDGDEREDAAKITYYPGAHSGACTPAEEADGGETTAPGPGVAVCSGYGAVIYVQMDFFYSPPGSTPAYNPFALVGDFNVPVTGVMLINPQSGAVASTGNTAFLTNHAYSEDQALALYQPAAGGSPAAPQPGLCIVCLDLAQSRLALNAGPSTYASGATPGMLVPSSTGLAIDLDLKDLGTSTQVTEDSIVESGDDPTPTVAVLNAAFLPTVQLNFPDQAPLDLRYIHIKWPGDVGAPIDLLGSYTKYSNLDDDAETDYTELTCTGQPTNPTNPKATCADWDGDGIANAADSQPRTPYYELTLGLASGQAASGEAPNPVALAYHCMGSITPTEVQYRIDGGPWGSGPITTGNNEDGDPDAYAQSAGLCGPPSAPVNNGGVTGERNLPNGQNSNRLIEFRLAATTPGGNTVFSTILSYSLLANTPPNVPITLSCDTGQTLGGKDPCVDANHNSDTVSYTYTVNEADFPAGVGSEGQQVTGVAVHDGIDRVPGTGDEADIDPMQLAEVGNTGVWKATYVYDQGYTVPLTIVISDSGGISYTNTAITLDVLDKAPSAVTLTHEPFEHTEVDFVPTLNYVFYVLVEGADGVPSGTIDIEETAFGGYSVDDGELSYLDCDDGASYPGYNWPSLRGQDGDLHAGISMAEAFCTMEDRDFEVLYWFEGFWTGGETFEYTFSVEGALSGPHIFDSIVYVADGHFLPGPPGGGPDPNDLCDDPETETFPGCLGGGGPDPNSLCGDPETETFPGCLVTVPETVPNPLDYIIGPCNLVFDLVFDATPGVLDCAEAIPTPEASAPGDDLDFRDTDGNPANDDEPNGQIDLVEMYVLYYEQLDGRLNIHVLARGPTLTPPTSDSVRLSVGDEEGTDDDVQKVLVVEDNLATQTVYCFYSAPDAALQVVVGAADTEAVACSDPDSRLTVWNQAVNVLGTTLGGQLGSRFGVPAAQQRPLIQVLDQNNDGAPDAIVLNVINPAGCTNPPSGPGLPTFTCGADDYVTQVIPIGALPDTSAVEEAVNDALCTVDPSLGQDCGGSADPCDDENPANDPPEGCEPGLPGSGDPLSCMDYLGSEDPDVWGPAWQECYTFLTGMEAPEGCDDPVFGGPFEAANCAAPPVSPDDVPIGACGGEANGPVPNSGLVYVCRTTGGILGLGIRIQAGVTITL